jgi:hypothetical protein
MNIEGLLENIQQSCNDFISLNIQEVNFQLEQNFTEIGSPLKEYKVSGLSPKTWGVYVFYMKPSEAIDSCEDLNELWTTGIDNKPLTCPAVIKGNFKRVVADEWTKLYVGKSENLLGRISQHIYQKTAPSTFSLKLSAHDRFPSTTSFAFSYFTLARNPSGKKDALKCLLVTLEKHLRKELKPLIGKQ